MLNESLEGTPNAWTAIGVYNDNTDKRKPFSGRFDGMDDYITVEDSENVNVAAFRLKCNDKYITDIMELPDYSVKQIDCTNCDSECDGKRGRKRYR